MDLTAKLDSMRREAPDRSWRPRLFQLGVPDERDALARLVEAGAVSRVRDTLRDQVADLARSEQPSRTLTDEEALRIADERIGAAPDSFGTWVLYPWSKTLVHTLPRESFRWLRTDRNRYKITPDDQRLLDGKRVAISGLSVGQAAAVTLALEGVGGHFHLADFDVLGLSNMNRMRAGIDDLGLEKTVMAARRMFEIDPFLDIELFPAGVRDETLEPFLAGVDLLVEECDDLYMKVRLRERARRLGIPVVMDTSDRGMLDVERFDREPARPILHGLLGDIRAESLRDLSTKDKVPFVLRILDASRLSVAVAASLVEVKETISTWPQLASGVALGGALVCDAARRILLGEMTTSGRFYVDLDEVVADGRAVRLADPDSLAVRPTEESLGPPPVIERPARRGSGGVTDDEVRYLVAHARLAPSAGNVQPWRFAWDRGEARLDGLLPDGPAAFGDFRRSGSHAAFGAAIENLDLAAKAIGLAARIALFPDGADSLRVCAITFTRGPAVESPLLSQVRLRVTNRRHAPAEPLSPGDAEAMREAAEAGGGRLILVEERRDVAEIGRILGTADRVQFLCEGLHRQVMGEMRWTAGQAEALRDGMELPTLEMSASDLAALLVCASWPVMERLRAIGGGRALEKRAQEALAASSAAGLVVCEGTGPERYFQGGRAMQRVWLTAAARGLSLQPYSALPYLLARSERGETADFSEAERAALESLRAPYRKLFGLGESAAEVLLFRVGHAAPPTARAIRRRLDDILSFR